MTTNAGSPVPPKESVRSKERLDFYLVRLGLAASRRAARELIARRMVRVNGRTLRKGEMVGESDQVEVESEPALEPLKPNPGLALEILHQDDALLVVNKPGLLPCHPLRPYETQTVMNAVVARFPEVAIAGVKRLEGGLIHRLDNGTSGGLIVARQRTSFDLLREAIRGGKILRRYTALVSGHLRGPLEVAAPIAHHARSRQKMVVARSPGEQERLKARVAMTSVEPLEHFRGFTLVSVTPRTGARHQIRVHLGFAGFPLAGDRLYGAPELKGLPAGRFFLHLTELDLESPAAGKINVKAALAPDLTAALSQIA